MASMSLSEKFQRMRCTMPSELFAAPSFKVAHSVSRNFTAHVYFDQDRILRSSIRIWPESFMKVLSLTYLSLTRRGYLRSRTRPSKLERPMKPVGVK
jgi:hypothetical protein